MGKKQTFETIEDQAAADRDAAVEASGSLHLDELYGEADRPQPVEKPKKPKKKGTKGKRKKGKGKKRWGFFLSVVLGLLLAALILGAGYLVWMLNRPQDLFTESVVTATEEPDTDRMEAAFDLSGFATPEPAEASTVPMEVAAATEDLTAVKEPAATAAPETEAPATAAPEADAPTTAAPVQEVQDNIVNILLMGIDAYEDGSTTSGSEPHTDVMMVIAVNFDKDTVDLITLPRDTFTTAPGLHGFYKLNGVFNAGGGMQNMEGGFALTRRAAEIWLGGISIPYYYAVDFQAVVDIVDAIGGIDYDVDRPFTAYRLVNGQTLTDSGKQYGLGMQHLDGNAVLQYLRMRMGGDGLDSSRTARQRRMMVAIFNKLKNEGKLSQIPELINAATSGIYTNTTLSQTTTLANYAMTKISLDQIRTRSISGDIWYQHYFKYCFVDQQNRINIIKEVYGIDAEPIGVNTPQFENWLYDIGFLAMKYVRQPEKVFQVIQEQKDQGKTFTDEQIAAYAACYQAYVALDEGFTACSERMQKAYVDTTLTEDQIKALEKEVKAQLEALNKTVKDTTLALRTICDIHLKLEWEVGARWFADQDINEVLVAFG